MPSERNQYELIEAANVVFVDMDKDGDLDVFGYDLVARKPQFVENVAGKAAQSAEWIRRSPNPKDSPLAILPDGFLVQVGAECYAQAIGWRSDSNTFALTHVRTRDP